MYGRILLILFFLLLSAGTDVALAQCGVDAWRPVVTIRKVGRKVRRVTRKATKPFEAFAYYKFDRSGPDWAPERNPQGPYARAFDVYGSVSGCAEKARLDNFAIQLQNEPASKGYLVISGPSSDYGKQPCLMVS